MGRMLFVLSNLAMLFMLSACDGDNDSHDSIHAKTYGIVSGSDGLLVFTSAKGKTWTQMDVPADLSQANFYGVAFSPKAPEKVWADAQHPNAIMTSTDTGKTWKRYEGDLEGCLPSRIEAADMDTAWVSCTSEGNQPFALKTDDGGTTWVRQDAGPPLEEADISMQGLSVVSPHVAWMTAGYGSGNSHRGLVLRTIDGGVIWEQKVNAQGGNDQLPPDLPYLAVAAISADEAWVVSAHSNTQGSSIYFTADGGSTWTLQAENLVGSGNDLNDIRIADGVVWIAGDMGTVFRSVNGGTAWEEFNTPSGGYNFGIAALDGATAWAVSSTSGSAPGGIVHTDDSGKTWDKQSYTPKSEVQSLLDVAFETEKNF